MPLTFTSTAPGTSSDYIKYLNGEPKKTGRQDEPDSFEFSLVPSDASFIKLKRGYYIKFDTATYTNWFTGYIINEPELEYLGTTGTNHTPTWGYRYKAISDEYILNLKPIGIIPPFTNETMGNIIIYLANRLVPGVFTTTGTVLAGIRLARFVPEPQAKFSDIVKQFCEMAQYKFWANNKILNFIPQDSAPSIGITIDGSSKHFTPSRLSMSPTPDLIINDAIVTGDVEPQNWIVEYFLGDALTGTFPMLSSAFGTDSSTLIDEDFGGSSIDNNKWVETDTVNDYLKVSSGYLNVLGGTNTQAYNNVLLSSQNLIPLSGSLRIVHGEFDFVNSGTNNIVQGVLGGLWTAPPSRASDLSFPNCAFGVRVNRDVSGNLFLRPIWAGAVDTNQSIQVDYTKRYIIRSTHQIRLGREVQRYHYLTNVGSIATRGGNTFGTTSQFYVTLTEINPSTGAVTNIYKWYNNAVVLFDSQTYANYVPVVSNEAHFTVTGITVSVPMQASLQQAKKINVLNSSFDDWASSSDLLSWTETFDNSGTLTKETSLVTTGNSAKITCGTGNQILTQAVNTLLSANKEYRATIRIRRNSNFLAGRVNVDLFGTGVDTTGIQITATTISTGDFDWYTALITPQGGLTSIPSDLVLRVFVDNSPTNGGILYVDDLRIYEEWAEQKIGPNELDSYDGDSPVATITGTNAGANTRSSTTGAAQYNPGQAALTYFKDSTKQTSTQPQVGELVKLRYRRAGASIGRSRDNTSILTESILWGDSGVRSLVKTDITPLPRTSADCEAAAAALVNDNSYLHVQGTYEQFSDYFTNEPKAGSPVQFQFLPSGMGYSLGLEEVNEVSSTMLSARPSERFNHVLSFGKQDLTKRFLQRFRKQDNIFTPQENVELPKFVDPAAVGTYFIDDVLSPTLGAWEGTLLRYSTNQAPPGSIRNLLLFSEQFDNAAWTKETGCTVTANSTLSPDNSNTTADSIVTTTSGNGITQTSNTAAASGVQCVFSVWLKCASGTQNVDLKINRGSGLNEETVTAAVTTSWKRFSITHSSTWTGTTNIVVIMRPTAASQTFIAWGAQLEVGSVITSYQVQTSALAADSGGFEVRYTDESWGVDDAKNLATRTSNQTFQVNRDFRGKIVFVKAYDSRNKIPYSDDMTQWTFGNGATAANATDTDPEGNNAVISTVNSNGFNTHLWRDTGITCAGVQYAVTGYVRGLGSNITKRVRAYMGSNFGSIPSIGTQSQLITLNGQWQPFTLLGQYDMDDIGNIRFYILNEDAVALSYQLSHVQLEINTNIQTPFCKTLANPWGAYSRFASAVRVSLPLIPPAPTATIDYTLLGAPKITVSLPAALTDVWGVEVRDSNNSTILYRADLSDPTFNPVVTRSLNTIRSLSYYVYTYNLFGEYSAAYNATATIPTPTVSSVAVADDRQLITWSGSNASSYLVEISTGTGGGFAGGVVISKTTGDLFFAFAGNDFVQQRYIKVTPQDSLGNGTASGEVSHIYTGVLQETSFRIYAQGYSAGNLSVVCRNDNSIALYTGTRSYNVLTIDRTTGALTHTTYDVYNSATNASTMATALNGYDNTKLVVVYSQDEPHDNRLTNSLPAAMERIGASGLFSSPVFRTRSAYILIGWGGAGKGNGIELYAGSVDSDTTATLDTSFTIKNGNIQGMSGGAPYALTPDSLTSTGTRSSSLSGKMAWTSIAATSATVWWDGTNGSQAVHIRRDNGDDVDISANGGGKVVIAYTTAGTYYVYPYWDEQTQAVSFVAGGSGTPAYLQAYNAGVPDQSKIQEMIKTNRISLNPGPLAVTINAGGGGGGGGTGGGGGGGGGRGNLP